MRYHVYLEAEPTLEAYRLSHQPRSGHAPVFICPFVVLTDSAGQLYNAMRGVQGQSKNETMNMGVYRLNGQLDDQCPVIFPYRDNPIAERYHVTETADAVSYVGRTWRLTSGRTATAGPTAAGGWSSRPGASAVTRPSPG